MGFGLPTALPLSAQIEESFTRRLATMPRDARRLLLLAAADSTGDLALVWRAAQRLGIPESAVHTVEADGLLALSEGVVFRHPLVRSAVYGAAEPNERREAHRALADETDPQLDPDRRAWHRAQAASVPDEEVAGELERSAARAQARGGLAAAAAFLEGAVTLTHEPSRRARRALAAAQTKFQAGALDDALSLLAMAETGALSDLERARAALLRAQTAFVATRGSNAPPLLLDAARRLAPLDPTLARETYLDALSAGMFAGRFAGPGGSALEVAQAASAAPPPPAARRAGPTFCSTLWPRCSATPTRLPCRSCGGRRPHSVPTSPRSNSCVGCGWRLSRQSSCGTTLGGRRCRSATFDSPVGQER